MTIIASSAGAMTGTGGNGQFSAFAPYLWDRVGLFSALARLRWKKKAAADRRAAVSGSGWTGCESAVRRKGSRCFRSGERRAGVDLQISRRRTQTAREMDGDRHEWPRRTEAMRGGSDAELVETRPPGPSSAVRRSTVTRRKDRDVWGLTHANPGRCRRGSPARGSPTATGAPIAAGLNKHNALRKDLAIEKAEATPPGWEFVARRLA
jgi:hypothetical protein